MSDVPTLASLPEPVRGRVHALTADVLPAVVSLPAPLRKVAAFAPARRARLGAAAIGAALDGDDDFRERVATQVAAKLPAPAADLVSASPGGDPVELAALGWLLRPEGWTALVGEAIASVEARGSSAVVSDAQLERLRRKLEDAEQAFRDARAKAREDLAVLKAENADLRRKLGETRRSLRDATLASAEAERALVEARAEARDAAAAADRELRQLRSRLERHEADAAEERRTTRAERDDATLRARLLLDTVLEATAGLQRELSLPTVSGAPADRIEADLAGEGVRSPSTPVGPALLDQYLAMPRARLIVDGYNVSKTAWPSSSLEAQRVRLVTTLAPLVARTRAETTVVFDAASSENRPVVNAPRGVKVAFSPVGVIADDVIRQLVDAEPTGRVVIVVTNDRELARSVTQQGARSVPSDSLIALLPRSG